MKKIILTESQSKLLLETINRNDSIQKLLLCNDSDINFTTLNESKEEIRIVPTISYNKNNKQIDDNIVDFKGKKIKLKFGEDDSFNDILSLEISLYDDIDNMDIITKLISRFIKKYKKPICLTKQYIDTIDEDVISNLNENFKVKKLNENNKLFGYIIY